MLDADTFKQLLETVDRFTRERLIPLEAQVAADDAVPESLAQEMREMGLFGLSIPEEYGGLGLGEWEEAQVEFIMTRASPAFRSLVGTNNGIGSRALLLGGTEDQKHKYLPRLASGEIIGSFALTEPGSGSDAVSLKTSARREGNGYVLNGTKRFITNSPEAGLITVFARTDPNNPKAGGISAFLVEAGTPGLGIAPPYKKMGQQGAHVADVILEDCFVPGEALLGEQEGTGFKTAMRILDRGRIHIAAACVGMAERLIDEALKYALEREQFGQPVAEFQLVQAMLADCKAEAYAARCMVEETARRKDADRDVVTEAACCKYFASEMVGRVADKAVQIFGGAGYIADYGIERFYRDARLFRIYEGTSQIQQIVIARNMIKAARETGL